MAGAGIFLAPNVFSFVGSPNEKVVIGMMERIAGDFT